MKKIMGPVVLLGVLVYCGAFAGVSDDFIGKKPPRAMDPLVQVPYVQDWEGGTAGWNSELGAEDPVALVLDPKTPDRAMVQRITRTTPGSYVSPLIRVAPGQLYCVRGWIHWSGGGWPFVGIERYASSGALGENWLIARPGYPDGLGGRVTPVAPEARTWRWYAKEVVMPPETVAVRLKDRMFGGEGKPGETLGLFDEVGISEGPCPSHHPARAGRTGPASRYGRWTSAFTSSEP